MPHPVQPKMKVTGFTPPIIHATPKFANGPPRQSVLTLLLEGYLCAEIAECYSLSPHTVKGYIRDIYRHFSVHSQLALIRLFRSQA